METHRQKLSFAAATDAEILRRLGVARFNAEYTIFSCPDNPIYRWGNRIHFADLSPSYDVQYCEQLMEKEFESEEIRHNAFSWDVQSYHDFPLELWKSAGYTVDLSDTLLMNQPPEQDLRSYGDLSIRPLLKDNEWNDAFECQLLVRGSGWSAEQYREFLRPKFLAYRKIAEERRGTWFGAFDSKDRQLGNLGIVICDGAVGETLARFQLVATHPSFRGQGVCTYLLEVAINHIFSSVKGLVAAVIVADPHYHAKSIYEKAGFSTIEHQVIVTQSKKE